MITWNSNDLEQFPLTYQNSLSKGVKNDYLQKIYDDSNLESKWGKILNYSEGNKVKNNNVHLNEWNFTITEESSEK